MALLFDSSDFVLSWFAALPKADTLRPGRVNSVMVSLIKASSLVKGVVVKRSLTVGERVGDDVSVGGRVGGLTVGQTVDGFVVGGRVNVSEVDGDVVIFVGKLQTVAKIVEA